MSGFVGYIEKKKRDNHEEIILKALDRIKHRGPNNYNFYSDKNLAFGVRSIQEDDSAYIFNKDKTKIIVFDGIIYNKKELYKELLNKKKTKNVLDAEIVMLGYEKHGEKILNKLRGMFAFVIYDLKRKELFGARDFFGIKPFYYYSTKDLFMAGSEVKSFLDHPNFKKELNKDLIKNYLLFQFSASTDTFFKNVSKLKPGHFFKYKNGKLKIKKYFEINFKPNLNKTHEEWKKELTNVLENSINRHLIGPDEVGSFLSSGIDSSYLVASGKINKTFTAEFENPKYNEIEHVKKFTDKLGIENYSKFITKEDYLNVIDKVMYHMDEPLADPSAIALYYVASLTSEHVDTTFSGEGADELFAGYVMYKEQFTLAKYDRIPYFIRFILGKIASIFPAKRGFNFFVRRGKKIEKRYIGGSPLFQDKEVNKIIKYKCNYPKYSEIVKPYYNKVKNFDDVTKMQFIDLNFWLVNDILLKADKMSMAHSLVVRTPYLDRDVLEFAVQIPTSEKIDAIQTKKIFREVAKSVLGEELGSRGKLGFPVPIREWLREEDVYLMIRKRFEQDDKFFNTKTILKILDNHYKGKEENMRKIWAIYSFLVWYDVYFQ